MGRGLSLHIGLNQVDPASYGGLQTLGGCHNDARAMQQLAEALGYETTLLLDGEATSSRVIAALGAAARTLGPEDILLVTYAGHGSRLPDTSREEEDGYDETWVLYDRELLDDELYLLWSQFPAGTRIVVVSDSCHAGSVTRAAYAQLVERNLLASAAAGSSRALPDAARSRSLQQYGLYYADIQWLAAGERRTSISASVLLLAACQDSQVAWDTGTNGAFTRALLDVWKDGEFSGSYQAFLRAIAERLPPYQTPRYSAEGARYRAFERQRPFTIEPPAR